MSGAKVYYNENDPYCAAWLRGLISEGLIAPGDVDERSIEDVCAQDLAGYAQHHFFAGLGGWSYALRLGGWPDSRAVWTGSCPCQPFSAAGKGGGFADERHLWPSWFWLIEQYRPAVIFGEQVARAHQWLALVRSDMEALGYAVGAMPIEAASIGANHKRDRYWFVADAGRPRWNALRPAPGAGQSEPFFYNQRCSSNVANAACKPQREQTDKADAISAGGQARDVFSRGGADASHPNRQPLGRPAEPWPQHCGWSTEPDVGRVAHGVPKRVAKLRTLGNAIVPQVAAEFIKAVNL